MESYMVGGDGSQVGAFSEDWHQVALFSGLYSSSYLEMLTFWPKRKCS